MDHIKAILTARVYDVARETPLDYARTLSARCGNEVFLKREDLQPVFSFKCRGAFNRIFKLMQSQPDTLGVVCASAGNHAQGVALAARELKLQALIVMPQTTPRIKVDAVIALGGEAVLHGDAYDEAYAHARQLEAQTGFAFIHPFDDADTIAGQGTVGVELCRQKPGQFDAVFVPIGGGGLAAGVSVLMKYLRPTVRIIGVEPEDSDCMRRSLAADKPVNLPQVGLFADGVAVRQPGALTFEICRETLDEVMTVTVDEMCAAIKDVFDDTRSLMEPAGALSVAGLKKYAATHALEGNHLVAITSGANMNFDRLRHVSERAEVGEQREALLAVTIPERSGSFRRFCELLGKRSVTEFNYRYANQSQANVFVGVQLEGGTSERAEITDTLQQAGLGVLDLTDDEMAKIHVRHMVGGSNEAVEGEYLYRFQFPERPGALATFLSQMGHDWNITLFHYRNHGAAFGRVLVGLQLPKSQEGGLQGFLDGLGYPYWPEQDNPAYRKFLTR